LEALIFWLFDVGVRIGQLLSDLHRAHVHARVGDVWKGLADAWLPGGADYLLPHLLYSQD
jgi:hypothetical protein